MSSFVVTDMHSDAEIQLLLAATDHDFVRKLADDIGTIQHTVYECEGCGVCVCLQCDRQVLVDVECVPEEA